MWSSPPPYCRSREELGGGSGENARSETAQGGAPPSLGPLTPILSYTHLKYQFHDFRMHHAMHGLPIDVGDEIAGTQPRLLGRAPFLHVLARGSPIRCRVNGIDHKERVSPKLTHQALGSPATDEMAIFTEGGTEVLGVCGGSSKLQGSHQGCLAPAIATSHPGVLTQTMWWTL